MARRQRKPRRPVKPRFRINNQIRSPKIRLVGDNLAELSKAVGREIASDIYSTREAIKMADAIDMDLIEISPNADPPVCRITDYKKFLFDKKKKEKEMKAKTVKTVIKEIRFGPNTDDHDFNFKARHAEKFLQEGAKVKAYVHFRGRTIVFKERGEVLLLRFVKHLEEFGTIESMPRMEGRRMFVLIAPKKSALKAMKKPKPDTAKSDKKKAKQAQNVQADPAVDQPIAEAQEAPDTAAKPDKKKAKPKPGAQVDVVNKPVIEAQEAPDTAAKSDKKKAKPKPDAQVDVVNKPVIEAQEAPDTAAKPDKKKAKPKPDAQVDVVDKPVIEAQEAPDAKVDKS